VPCNNTEGALYTEDKIGERLPATIARDYFLLFGILHKRQADEEEEGRKKEEKKVTRKPCSVFLSPTPKKRKRNHRECLYVHTLDLCTFVWM
jgi:hypothetical protein